MQTTTNRRINLRYLIGGALLTALSIILTRFFSHMIPLAGIPALRFGFGTIPIVIAGILYGPLVGGMVGVVADLVGFFINPMGGSYFPGFTVSAGLNGVLPGLIFTLFKEQNPVKTVLQAIAIGATVFLTLNGIWIYGLGKAGIIEIKSGMITLLDSVSIWVFIFYVISIILASLIPVFIFRLSTENKYSFKNILFTVAITYMITSIFLNTLWLTIMSGTPAMVFLPGRLIGNAVSIPLDAIIILALSKTFKYINK